MTLLMAAPIWHCHPDHITCGAYPTPHHFTTHRSGFHQRSRVDGHLWEACTQCSPTRFFLGVVRGRSSDPFVVCYLVEKPLFDWWANEGAELELTGTLELLHYLGYAPQHEAPWHTKETLRRLHYPRALP